MQVGEVLILLSPLRHIVTDISGYLPVLFAIADDAVVIAGKPGKFVVVLTGKTGDAGLDASHDITQSVVEMAPP